MLGCAGEEKRKRSREKEIKVVLDRYCVSVSIHSLLYSIGEYDISVCVSPPIPIRPLQ